MKEVIKHIIDILDQSHTYKRVNYQLSFRKAYDGNQITLISICLLIFLAGTIGNVIVIKLFIQSTDQPGSRLVVALAVIDLICSVLVPLNNIVENVYGRDHWPLGKAGCLTIKPWMSSTFYGSAWMLVAISLERVR